MTTIVSDETLCPQPIEELHYGAALLSIGNKAQIIILGAYKSPRKFIAMRA